MCEWKLDGVWKLSININSCLIYPSGLQDKQHTHVLQINMHLYVCFRPNRICTSVSIQNLHLIIYSRSKLYVHLDSPIYYHLQLSFLSHNFQLRKIPEPFFAKKQNTPPQSASGPRKYFNKGHMVMLFTLKDHRKKKAWKPNALKWIGWSTFQISSVYIWKFNLWSRGCTIVMTSWSLRYI